MILVTFCTVSDRILVIETNLVTVSDRGGSECNGQQQEAVEHPPSLSESAGPGNDPDSGHIHLSAITTCSTQSLLAAL